jgi:hypothetical protein
LKEWNEVIKPVITMVLLFVSLMLYIAPLNHKRNYSRQFVFTVLLEVAIVLLYVSVACRGIFVNTGIWIAIILIFGIVVALILTNLNLTGALLVSICGVTSGQFLLTIWDYIFAHLASIMNLGNNYWFVGIPVILIQLAFMYHFISSTMPIHGLYDIGPRQTTLSVIILFLFEIMVGGYYPGYLQGNMRNVTALSIVTEFCIMVLLYLFHSIFKNIAMQKELATLDLLYHQQKKQYELSKENIEIINHKVHDLKHQVRALRELPDRQRDEFVNEITDSIRIYESIVHTGSDVLDTILTEKSLRCNSMNIQVNCVADGAKLSFIDTIDLYTIFGNALDNAIEVVRQFKDSEKRQIDIVIYAKDSLLNIEIVNPIERMPVFKDGIPVTTKEDKNYHGYGLKSIRRAALKYNGWVTITTVDDCFSLKILFSLENR